MSIFEEEQVKQNQDEIQLASQENKDRANIFQLSQQQKNNINKRLPRGFFLIRKQQYDKLGYMKKQNMDEINYEPVKVQRKFNFNNMIVQSIHQSWAKKQQEMRKSNKFGLQYTVEGRSRQSQKIKNIIQRFRKLIKNSSVQNFLNKLGYMMALNQIEVENKKGLLTIDTFKARYMVVLQTAKSQLFETQVINQTDEMIEEFLCYVEQARKAEFENNIQSIQKSIDKITRYLSQTTDNKTQSNWYFKKKKKTERNQNYTEKQILYIGELIKKLPMAYLVGLWQIVNERPFLQSQKRTQLINLTEIGNKKLRDIETYVKAKLSQLYRSRLKKKQKLLLIKKKQKIQQQKGKNDKINQVKMQTDQLGKNQKRQQGYQEIDDLKDMFENQQQFQVKKETKIIKPQFLEDFIEVEFDLNNQNLSIDRYNEGKSVKREMQQQGDQQIQNYNQQAQYDYYEEVELGDQSDSSIITDEDDSDF